MKKNIYISSLPAGLYHFHVTVVKDIIKIIIGCYTAVQTSLTLKFTVLQQFLLEIKHQFYNKFAFSYSKDPGQTAPSGAV